MANPPRSGLDAGRAFSRREGQVLAFSRTDRLVDLPFRPILPQIVAMQYGNRQDRDALSGDAIRIGMMEAIAGKLLVTATYNGQDMTLAPHALFLRHGEMFVSALNRDKKWRADESPRLGHFKLAGLTNFSVTREHFEVIAGFDETTPQAEDELVLSVA